MEDFLKSVCNRYNSNKENKIQGYAEIINKQRGEFIIIENTRVWLTNTFTTRCFNDYVKSEIRDDIVKRKNGQRGSSWFFKRFNRLTVIVAPVDDVNRIFSS